ncbi:hypothetical protein [Vulgatibacter sp.]|uniref:hypothetical protein n=1 Tax=Vulgatibacter sp. TaxID=1971226 RepID=UPI003568E61D
MSEPRRPAVRLAEDHVPARVAYGALAFVVVFGALLVFWAWILYSGSLREFRAERDLPAAPARRSAVGERLFGTSGSGWERLRLQEEGLSRWRWADREAGIVDMPIEEAMRLLVEEAEGR